MKKLVLGSIVAAVVLAASSAFATVPAPTYSWVHDAWTLGTTGTDTGKIVSWGGLTANAVRGTVETVNDATLGTSENWMKSAVTYNTATPPAVNGGTGFYKALADDISVANGLTFITAVRPEEITSSTSYIRNILNVFGNQLQIGMLENGELKVRRVTSVVGTTVNTDTTSGPKLEVGKATVLSFVIQADGSFNMWSSASATPDTALTMSGGLGATNKVWENKITSLVKIGTTAGSKNSVCLGSAYTPGGSNSWRGLLGDSYFYSAALTEDERKSAVSDVMLSMGLTVTPEPSSAMALGAGLFGLAGFKRFRRK